MATQSENRRTLSDLSARRLACTTKSVPQMTAITPRWLISLMSWVPVEAGTYRVNRVRGEDTVKIVSGRRDENIVPGMFVDYEENPREYSLGVITTVLDVHTRTSDLYNHPHDQIREQLRLAVELVKERQETELLQSQDYGLLNNVAPAMRFSTRTGPPTPDDLDELIARVWKEPAFFLAHPRAIAAFGRECTLRGVPPATTTMFGSPFLTWRGIPLVPCDKIPVSAPRKSTSKGEQTSILLIRTGEKRQGVVGLYQQKLQGEKSPGLSVRLMGIGRDAIASYLITLYCSAAVLAEDALGMLEHVDLGTYHEYK